MRATGGLDGNGVPAERTFFSVGCGCRSFLLPLHPVDTLDYQKHGKGYDDKADDGIDKDPQP